MTTHVPESLILHVNNDVFRAQRDEQADVVRRLRGGERDMERTLEEKERQLLLLMEESGSKGGQLEEVKRRR